MKVLFARVVNWLSTEFIVLIPSHAIYNILTYVENTTVWKENKHLQLQSMCDRYLLHYLVYLKCHQSLYPDNQHK